MVWLKPSFLFTGHFFGGTIVTSKRQESLCIRTLCPKSADDSSRLVMAGRVTPQS